jgi:uncharacterized membrane protein
MNEPESLDALGRRLDQLERDVRRIGARLGEVERALQSRAEAPLDRTPELTPRTESPAPSATIPPLTPSPSITPSSRPIAPSGTQAPSRPVASPGTQAPRAPSVPPPEPAWKDWLRRVNMLPPGRGASVEAELGTWWLTRIGALILVLGVVFFGIYVSRFSRPWVRLAEVIGAAATLGVLGFRMERGYRQFGAVLLGGGLALSFFAAFGAYALPAIKVIDSAAWGAAWQFAAAGAIAAVALARGSATIASMATLCGYAACFFSFKQGFNDFALVAAWTLGAGAAALSLRRGWGFPLRLAVPLAYVIYACIVLFGWSEPATPRPRFIRAEAFPLATMILFIGADWAALRRGLLPAHWPRRLQMLCNTTGAIGLGLLATYAYHPEHYAAFYFAFGATLLAAAGIYRLTAPEDGMAYLFYVKGSALISLGLISYFKSLARWLALAAQSLVLLLSARRSRMKRLVEATATTTWLASLGFFVVGMARIIDQPSTCPPIFSKLFLMALGYLLFSAWLMSAKSRWLEPKAPEDAAKQSGLGWLPLHRERACLLALLAGASGVLFIHACIGQAYRPLGLILLTAAIVAVAVADRHWMAAVAATPPLLAAHLWFRLTYGPGGSSSAGNVALNVLLVAGLTLAGAVALDEWLARRRNGDDAHRRVAPGVAALHALWILSFLTAWIGRVPHGLYLLIAVALAAALVAAAATRLRHLYLADLAALPLAVALFDLSLAPQGDLQWKALLERLQQGGATHWLAPMAALGAFGFTALCRAWPAARGRFVALAPHGLYQWLHVALAGAIGLGVVEGWLAGAGLAPYWRVAALPLAGLAIAMLARWPGVRPAIWPGPIYAVYAWLRFWITSGPYRGPDNLTFLWLAIVGAAAMVALALAVGRLRPDLAARKRTTTESLLGAMAMIVLLIVFGRQRGELATYATVFWGLSAIAIFVAGLAGRSKPLRVVSLIGLAACIARIFMVDASSAIDRIFAFIGVGIVLLAVGFLYNKYGDRLARRDEKDPKDARNA